MNQRRIRGGTFLSAADCESRTTHFVGIHREQSKACHSTKQNQCKAEAVSSLTQSMYGHQPVDGGATQSIGDVTPCLPLQHWALVHYIHEKRLYRTSSCSSGLAHTISKLVWLREADDPRK